METKLISSGTLKAAEHTQASHTGRVVQQGPKPFGPRHSFKEKGWHVWCGDIVQDQAGLYHLFYCRWPASEGYEGWVTHSEIARAVGTSLDEDFTFESTVFDRSNSKERWDSHCFHNVTVRQFGDKYYLYYMGNTGDGTWWGHRNRQRIGVAVADSPAGPWKRLDHPVLDVSPDSWDGLMVSNPTVTDTVDGRYVMIYKGVSTAEDIAGGRVLHGIAWADSPLGPFVKTPKPILDFGKIEFAFEDPCLWREGSKFFCIVKDMGGYYSPLGETSLLLLESDNAIDWKPSQPFLVLGRTLQAEDGSEMAFERVERPQLFFDRQGRANCLIVAVKPYGEQELSYNIRLDYAANGKHG